MCSISTSPWLTAKSVNFPQVGVPSAAVGQNPDSDISEYYVALFYNALNTLRYQNLAVEQREHALLCASLLAERIA